MKQLYEKLDARPSFVYSIPFSVAFPLAYLVDAIVALLKPIKEIHPTFTVFRMKFLSTNRYFCINKAKTLLGYSPIINLEQGIEQTVQWLNTIDKK